MLGRVGEGLLRDSVERRAGGGGQGSEVPVHDQRDIGAGSAELADQLGDLGGAGGRWGDTRCSRPAAEKAHGAPHLVEAVASQALGLVQRPGRVGRVGLHSEAGGGDMQ